MNISSHIYVEQKKKNKTDLERCAFGIVERYQKGAIVELRDYGWQMTWKYLLKELRSCSPGFMDIEYGIALHLAFTESR